MEIQWNANRKVYFNPELGEAYVKVSSGWMELDDYREHGGRVEDTLPAGSHLYGVFTNAQISNMPYPS